MIVRVFPDLKTLAGDFNFPGSMKQFIKHFRREGVGVWVCVADATLALPEGRVQVAAGSRFTLGTKFMNVELAAMLEEQHRLSGGEPSA